MGAPPASVAQDTSRLAVLLVEDDEGEARRFRDALRAVGGAAADGRVVAVRTAAEARQAIASDRFDLAVIDHRLGGEDGLDLVRQLRGAGLETPILMLSEAHGEEVAVEMLRAGATDYLAKARLDAESLRRSVRYALDLSRQARLRRTTEDSLRLREEQLREAQRLETVATLSSGVAHEFNNLLNVIVGYADMARRKLPQGDPLHRNVEQILQAAEKASQLTRQLQAFGRNQVLQPTVIEVASLLADLAPVVRSVMGRRSEVVVRADPDPGRIKVDRSQIDHALMSLIVNARDAMPEGGRLTIESRIVEIDDARAFRHDPFVRRGRYVLLAVSDTGSGMSPEVQARAFEPFFTTKGRANATGLGLSTVHGIIRQSDGHVWLYSEPGQGTTVKIHLPLVDAAGRLVELEAPRISRGDEVILLVDDEATMREVVAESLRGAGYAVIEAGDAAEALRAAERGDELHLLLSDVMMPGMNGPELARRLRGLRPSLKVVYMSGATREALRQRDEVLDAPFLWKPFSVEELTHAVRQVLDGA